jgi:hypothetical protein
MRSYHVIAVGVFLAVGFAVTVLLSPDVRAHLNPIYRDHPNITGLPLQEAGGTARLRGTGPF